MIEKDSDSLDYSFFAADGTNYHFKDYDTAKSYLEEEKSEWEWIKTLARSPELSAVINWCNSFSNDYNPRGSGEGIALHTKLHAYFQTPFHIQHPGEFRSLLNKYKKQNSRAAALLIAWLLGLKNQLNEEEYSNLIKTEPIALETEMLAREWSFRLSQPDRELKRDERRLLEENYLKLISNTRDELDILRREIESVEKLKEDIKPWFDDQRKKMTADFMTRIESKYKEAEASLEALKSIYMDQNALEAPSTYWHNKGDKHGKLAKTFTKILLATTVVGAVILGIVYWYLFDDTSIYHMPTWRQTLPAVLASILLLWTVKTLIRLTLSHVHLSIDSDERQVMIKSYMAMAHQKEINEHQRTALFAAIFRPTGNGLIAEESPPVPFLELLKGGKS